MGSLACDLDTMHGRLKAARLATGITQEETADLVGLTKGGISQMEQGKRPVSKRHLRMMALMLGVNEQWILQGEGEMLMDRKQNFQCQLQEIWGLSADEATLIANFVTAPPDHRKAIFKAIDMINNWRLAPSPSI